MIYHILDKEIWNQYRNKVNYTSASLDREGYIHCSYRDQVLKVANSLLKGSKNQVVLCIDDSKLGKSLVSEDLFNLLEDYPHVYGPIPTNSIVKVVPLDIDEDGEFIPPNLEPLESFLVKEDEWT